MKAEVNGIELYYELHGEGEPLLWLHGFGGGGSDWRHVFSEPPAGFLLIAPDLRGHGESTDTAGPWTFRHAAADVLALLDHLSVDRVKGIGVSGGGIVLLHLATAAPARLSSMVLVSAPPWFPAEARAIQRQFSPAMVSEADLQRMRNRHRREGQLDRVFAHARGFADSYDDVNFTPPLLSTISAETLVVFGDVDPFYPVGLAFELRAAIPRSSLWVVPRGGHSPVFGSNAPAFADRALRFLRGEP